MRQDLLGKTLQRKGKKLRVNQSNFHYRITRLQSSLSLGQLKDIKYYVKNK